MAQNKIQDGVIIRLPVGATVESGDPITVGNGLRGVALTDYDSADGKASVEVARGVYDLSVQAIDDAGNSPVAIGDRLYFTGSAAPFLSKKKSGKFFGIALEVVLTGATSTINVLVGGVSGIDNASHVIIASGIHTVADSPLDTNEFIALSGCLATDVVIAIMHTNGGSPAVSIVSAVASASPAGITITASGTFTTGDKINYAVLRAAI